MRTAIFVRDVLRVPIRIVFTSAAQRSHSMFPRWLISRMDAVIATTELAASFVPNVAAVVPHGVDTDRFRPAPNRSDAWARTGFPGRRGIATVGRVRPEKGTDRFVDAMIAVLPAFPDVTALVIGAATGAFASFDKELRDRVANAGLSDRIIFTGEIEPERLRLIYQGLSVLVALPRYEGYGMTALEAMASGTPVVLSDTGNFREFAGDGAGGAIVDAGNGQEVAEILKSLMIDDQSVETMGLAGRVRTTEFFSVDAETENIREVYDRVERMG
jgi:mannosyltransferase